MFTAQSIFTNGWIQIAILLAIFYGFTRWSLSHGLRTGYALGWLVGLFFIVIYSSLFPDSPLQVSNSEPPQLTFVAVVASSVVGMIIGVVIIGTTFVLQKAWFRQVFATASITSILVTLLFLMIMSSTPVKMALSLSSLAFAIVIGIGLIIRRAYLN